MVTPPEARAASRTLLDVVRLSTTYLGEHGSSSPRLDAELIAAHALGVRRLDVYLQFDRVLAGGELEPLRELIRRRGAGEPVAYITGEREFYSRPFSVSTRYPSVPVDNVDNLAVSLVDGGGRS